MPNIGKRQVRYVTDLGLAIEQFQFKIRQDKGGVVPAYQDAVNQVCSGTGNLFKPRAIVAEYADRSVIRYPVPEPTIPSVRATATAAMADGAVCVHLDGESWSNVPNSFLGDVQGNRFAYVIPDGPALKESGRFDYTSDLLGPVQARYSIEINPLAISQAMLGCLANPTEGNFACAPSNQITTRALFLIANNANGGQIKRKTSPQNVGGDVTNCGEALLAAGYCVQYKGESARNIQILVPAINP